MRYRGQRHNIKVPVSGLNDAAAIRDAFERDYRRRYGHADPKAPAEFQALHLSAFARLNRPEIARLPRSAGRPGAVQNRQVYFGTRDGWIDTKIFHRDLLEQGFASSGPAVIEEYGSTTLVWPGDRFEIGALGEIRIHIAAGAST
jgi:N-methylhydantoinase A